MEERNKKQNKTKQEEKQMVQIYRNWNVDITLVTVFFVAEI